MRPIQLLIVNGILLTLCEKNHQSSVIDSHKTSSRTVDVNGIDSSSALISISKNI